KRASARRCSKTFPRYPVLATRTLIAKSLFRPLLCHTIVAKQPARASRLVLLLIRQEAGQVERRLVRAGPQLGVRLPGDGLDEGTDLGHGGLEVGEEVAAPEDVAVVGVRLVAVDVEELVERLDGVGGGSRARGSAVGQAGEQGDEEGADLAVAVDGRGVQ